MPSARFINSTKSEIARLDKQAERSTAKLAEAQGELDRIAVQREALVALIPKDAKS